MSTPPTPPQPISLEELKKIILDALNRFQGKIVDPDTETTIDERDYILKVKDITTDPTRWSIIHMKDFPALWKVVDANGKNVATNFVSLAKATAFIEYVLENHLFPKGDPATYCPLGHHWDAAKRQCVENEKPPEPDPECPEGSYYDKTLKQCIEGIPPPPPPPPVTDGAVDKYGTKYLYSDGKNVRYDFHENFQDGNKSMRWDYICGHTFLNCELKCYVRAGSGFDDEVSFKMRGGKHSDGLHPKTYDMGIEVLTGKSRYRTEDEHPVYKPGGSGGTGVPLGTGKWVGYAGVCFNEPGDQSVRIELWQDANADNNWKKLATWSVKDPLWTTVADDHQETIRIDNAQKANLEIKNITLAEIPTSRIPTQ